MAGVEDTSEMVPDDVTPKELLDQLTDDLNTLDEQEKESKKTNKYVNNRYIFLLQSTLLGISYSIIWPTLWIYVKNVFQLSPALTKLVYGLTFVAYPVASFLSAYIVERSTLSTKTIVMLLCLAEIIGNLIFTLHYHAGLLVIGRFIAGLGDAFYVILMKDMKARNGYTNNQNMTMECLAAFIFGIILSPGINLVTSYAPFTILAWNINVYNYPGLSAAVLFILMELIILIFLPAASATDENVRMRAKKESVTNKGASIKDWDFKSYFVVNYSFLYTFIVAFFEISLPVILHEKMRVLPVESMMLYAILGVLYAVILVFVMTVNFKNQLEASIGASILAKTLGIFGILYLGYSGVKAYDFVCIGAVTISLPILWTNDDILFINLVRTVIPVSERESTHEVRKTYSKVAFAIASVTVPFCLKIEVFVVMGPVLLSLVYLFFCMFVFIRCIVCNKK